MKLFAEQSLWPFIVAVAVGVACSAMITPAHAAPLHESASTMEAASQDDTQRGREALEAARQHADAGRWQRAADAYSEALRYLPDDPEAREGLQRALSMLERADTIEQVEDERERQRQRAIIEFDDALSQARQALAEGEYSDAERTMVTARVRLNRAREFLREAEFADRDQRAEALLAEIEEARIVEQLRREEQRRREAERQRREEEDRVRRERERQIEENLRRVRQLQQELRYDEALQVIEEILFIDELNPAALALRDVMRTSELYRDYAEIQQEKERGFARLTIEGQRAMIPPRINIDGPGRRSISGIVEFPEDWPQLSLRRTYEGEGFHESPDNRAVLQRMSDARVPIDFRNNTFEEVVSYMTQVSGLNIYVDWRALEMIGVYRDSEVNLQLGDLPVSTALDRVLDQLGDDFDRPSYTVQDGMLMVSSDDALRRQTNTIVYDIRDLLFEPQSVDSAPSFNLNRAQRAAWNNPVGNSDGVFERGNEYVASVRGGRRSEPAGGGGAGGGLFGDPYVESPATKREERVRQLISILQETIDPEGWRDLGGDTGSIQELNGNLIITNTPRNHRQITGLLSQLREIRALQISVEAKVLNVSTNWFEQIGVDLDLYFNTNKTMFRQARAADPNFHLSDFFDGDGRLRDPVVFGSPTQVQSGDVAANVVPSGSFIGVPSGLIVNGFEQTEYFVAPVGTPIRNRRGFSPIGITQDSLGLTGALANLPSTFSQAALASPALAIGMQFLDDVQVDLLIEATQADRRSVVMSAPRVTFFNDTSGWLQIQQVRTFVATVIPIVQEGGVAFQPIPEPLEDGFTLLLHGVVSSDKRYVNLNVQFQTIEFIDFDTATVTGQARGGTSFFEDMPGQAFAAEFSLPEFNIQNIFASVSVPDKGTVMLGGWRNVREIEVETGVPVLSKIPFVNRFFTNRLTSKEEESLLILIRPEIIIQHEHEDTLFPGLSDQIGGSSSTYLR